MSCKIVVLYYSRDGNTRRMANQIARGISLVDGCEAVLRTVPEVTIAGSEISAGEDGIHAPFISKSDLREAGGLIVGSPTRFGNMAAPLKHFFDSTSDLWLGGELCDKPAAVFTSTSTMHGGQESTLFTMMLPLLHHGMVMVGIPYKEPALSSTTSGGTPYGASHVSGTDAKSAMTQDEKKLCSAIGKRVAKLALKIATNSNSSDRSANQ